MKPTKPKYSEFVWDKESAAAFAVAWKELSTSGETVRQFQYRYVMDILKEPYLKKLAIWRRRSKHRVGSVFQNGNKTFKLYLKLGDLKTGDWNKDKYAGPAYYITQPESVPVGSFYRKQIFVNWIEDGFLEREGWKMVKY